MKRYTKEGVREASRVVQGEDLRGLDYGSYEIGELSIAIRRCRCGGALMEVIEDKSTLNPPIHCGEVGCR